MRKSSYHRNNYLIKKTPVEEVEFIENSNDINSNISETKTITLRDPLYQIKVIHSSLRKRSEPSLNGEILGFIIDKGKYNIYNVENNWGQLEDGSWICLDYTIKSE